MKRAFIVVGPESSGNRLMTRLLVEAGCFGAWGHEQLLDKAFPTSPGDILTEDIAGDNKNIVLRRSIPYGPFWPDLEAINDKCRTEGFDTFFIILMREWRCMALSKVNQKHKEDGHQAFESISKEYLYIFDFLVKVKPRFMMIDTSLIFIDPDKALWKLEQMTGFNFDKSIIYDADRKYGRRPDDNTCLKCNGEGSYVINGIQRICNNCLGLGIQPRVDYSEGSEQGKHWK